MTTATIEKQQTTQATTTQARQIVRPQVDIYENDQEFVVVTEMAGVAKEDLTINLENNILSLSGLCHEQKHKATRLREFANTEYRNSFSVPDTIETKAVNAKLTNGILHLTLPKIKPVKPKVIEVQ